MICRICINRLPRDRCDCAGIPMREGPNGFYGPTRARCIDTLKPDGTCPKFAVLHSVSENVAVWPLVDVILRGVGR
jgi:hypothetical protein